MPTPPTLRSVHHQPSWRIASDRVEAFLTETGGMLGPVTFDRKGRNIQPLAIAPWHGEKLGRATPSLLKALRGDFFCMPFGSNAKTYKGETHPPHGETANAKWSKPALLDTADHITFECSLKTRARPLEVTKNIILRTGHDFVYQTHLIEGGTGRMSFGHHAMLAFPDPPGSGIVSTSPFAYGQVSPEPFENPAAGGYFSLQPAAEFDSLEHVPTLTGDDADVSRYPAREGFEDLVMILAEPSLTLGWTAVTFPRQRYAWFSLKNPAKLPGTVLWLSNGGRHYAPWNGRHRRVMGLEDVNSYFHFGLAESAKKNPFTDMGRKTCVTLNPRKPTVVRYGFGVAELPPGFDRVARIEPNDAGTALTLLADNGKTATAAIDLDAVL